MAENSQAIGSIFAETLATQTEREEESDLGHIEPRQATLFLIDTSCPMFEQDRVFAESYFMKSILTYKNNLQMLCGFNRDDWMSLILFSTTEWDRDPEIENVLTVQKFQKVTLEMLLEIKEKIEGNQDYFNLLSSPTAYPLHDALWHASNAFSDVKTVIVTRKIVLLTCEDNPFAGNESERSRIEARVSTFKNLGIIFRVIGFDRHFIDNSSADINFDYSKFYEKLENIALGLNTNDRAKNLHNRLTLDDLQAEIQFPSRTISNIFWRFSDDVEIPVSIFTLSTETKYPDSVHIDRTTNEPLKSFTLFKKKSAFDDEEDEEDNPENEGKFNPNVVAPGGLAQFQEHGFKKLVFDRKEVSMMFDHFKKGIETLCFKPLECDPMYHVEPPKFLTFHSELASESQKQFFATLVEKCETKGLMAVCRISYRLHTAPNVFYFYPSKARGGFFIYKMCYEDHVRDLDTELSDFIYGSNGGSDDNHDGDDGGDRKNCGRNWKHRPQDEVLQVFDRIFKKTKISFDQNLFKNPKLGTQMANIEALALDLNRMAVPPDYTLPSKKIEDRLEEIMPEYYRIFHEEEGQEEAAVPTAKRVKLIDNSTMQNLVRSREVENCTVAQLKEFLKQQNITFPPCRKPELIRKVYDFFRT